MEEPEHVYLSTACFHEEHNKCKLNCKYCDAPCICDECDHKEKQSWKKK